MKLLETTMLEVQVFPKENTPFSDAETLDEYANALWERSSEILKNEKSLRPIVIVLLVNPEGRPEGEYIGLIDAAQFMGDVHSKEMLATVLHMMAKKKEVRGIGMAFEAWVCHPKNEEEANKVIENSVEKSPGRAECLLGQFELRGSGGVVLSAPFTHAQAGEGEDAIEIGELERLRMGDGGMGFQSRFAGFFEMPRKENLN